MQSSRVFEAQCGRLARARQVSDETQVWVEQRDDSVFAVQHVNEAVGVDDGVQRRVGVTPAAKQSSGRGRCGGLGQPVDGRLSPVNADGDHPPPFGSDPAMTDKSPTGHGEPDGVPRVADVRVKTDDPQCLSVSSKLFQLLSNETADPDRTYLLRGYTQHRPFDAHCCPIGTAIKHHVPERVKPSFVIFDIWALLRSALMVPFERAMVVSYRLSILTTNAVTCSFWHSFTYISLYLVAFFNVTNKRKSYAIRPIKTTTVIRHGQQRQEEFQSNHQLPFGRNLSSNFSGAQINRIGVLWAKYGEDGADRCKPNFKTILERHWAVVRERNLVDIFCRLSTMHERVDRQTNRSRKGNVAQ